MAPAAGGAAASQAQAAANTLPQRPAHAKEYNFLDMELKYGFLQVSGTLLLLGPDGVTQAICYRSFFYFPFSS